MQNLSRYIGLPFADKGRGPAFDCWGLVRLFYAEQFGIVLLSHADEYETCGNRMEVNRLIEKERETGDWVPVKEPRFGDLVCLRIGGQPWHVGIALGDGRMLHNVRGIDSAIERLTSPMWTCRIEGYYRHVAAAP